jgi:hypothetical protein
MPGYYGVDYFQCVFNDRKHNSSQTRMLLCRVIMMSIIFNELSMIVSIIAAKNMVFYTLVIYRMIYDDIITQTPNK